MLPEVQLNDIYGYIYVSFWQTFWGKFLIGSIFFAVITFFIFACFYIIRRRRACCTPEQVALAVLEGLEVRVCVSRGEFKSLYFDLTRVVKLYLQERFEIRTYDKTDCEIVVALGAAKHFKRVIDIVQVVLQGAQGVRFANEVALKKQVVRDIKRVNSLVALGIVYVERENSKKKK